MSNFFPSDQTNKITSGRVKKYSGQQRVGLLFTAGQKYALVELGQGPSLISKQKERWHELEASVWWLYEGMLYIMLYHQTVNEWRIA